MKCGSFSLVNGEKSSFAFFLSPHKGRPEAGKSQPRIFQKNCFTPDTFHFSTAEIVMIGLSFGGLQ